MEKFKLLFAILIATALLAFAPTVNALTPLTPQSNIAKEKIIDNASKAVDNRWDRFDLLIGSVKGDDSNFTIYKPSNVTLPPPPVCGPGTHEDNGKCVPNVTPCPTGQVWNSTSQQCEPKPTPPPINNTGKITTIDLSADFSGTNIINAMNGDINAALGDLLYQSNIDGFIKVWDKKTGHACTPGNHDQEEDGNAQIAKQSSQYCGDVWVKKTANGTTVLIGANTNGDLNSIKTTALTSINDPAFMAGVKNVLLLTHKPCEEHPNAHHTVEAAVGNFCNAIKSAVQNLGINFASIHGHNHEIASKKDGSVFLVGGGGKSTHRGCGTDNQWTFCKATDGFLRLEIDNNSGAIKAKFLNANGAVIA